MQQNWDSFYSRVLKDEGTKYEDVPGDNGGPTCCGITIADVAEYYGLKLKFDKQGRVIRGAGDWAKALELTKALNPTTAAPIYKKKYWDGCRADDLPSGVDYMTVDYSVNSGKGRGIPTLGRLVGVQGSVVTDKMLAAVKNYGRMEDLINHYQDVRQQFLITISDPDSRQFAHNYKFRNGWLARVKRVRETAIAMARAAAPVEAETPVAMISAMPKAVDLPPPPPPSKTSVALKSKSVGYSTASLGLGLAAKIKFVVVSFALGVKAVTQNLPDIIADANSDKQTFVDLGNTIGTPEIVGGVLTLASIAFLVVAIWRHVDFKQTALAQGVEPPKPKKGVKAQ